MSILATRYPVYQPAMRIIESISNSFPECLITTTFPHQYQNGLIVRLNIPEGFGMTEMNGKFGSITIASDTTFSMSISTLEFGVFQAPTNYPFSYQSATVTPIGEDNSILTQATQNVLPYSAT